MATNDESTAPQRWPPRVAAFFLQHPDWRPTVPSGVPAGWDAPVAEALDALHALSQATGVGIGLAQVKEKFGELRIYLRIDEVSATELQLVDQGPGHVRLRSGAAPGSVRERAVAIADRAAAQTQGICVRCGAPKAARVGWSWFCTAHARQVDGGG